MTFYKNYTIIIIERRKEIKMINKSECKTKRPMSPLQRLYNIEKTLFPNMKTTKSDIDNFEKTLIEIYSEKRKK